MAIDRAVVADAEIIENHAWRDEALQSCFRLVSELACGFAADPLEEPSGVFMEVRVGGIGHQAVQVIRNGAHIFGNRPFVVVENDDEALGGRGDIVQGFKTHAAGEGGISRHADDMLVGADLVASGGHAKRGGEGGSGMACPIGIVLTLAAKKKSVESLVLSDRRKSVESSGQELVDIALVADIENELVFRCVEHPVQCNREFDHTEIRPQMAAGLGKNANQFLADFLGQAGQLLGWQGLDILRGMNLGQQRAGNVFRHASVFLFLELFQGNASACVACDDLDSLLGGVQFFLAVLHKADALFVAINQLLQR